MASIFKRPRDGNKRNATWWIEYTNEFGTRKRKKGFTDRRLTEQLAAELEDQVRLKTSGLEDPILKALADHRDAPIDVHLHDYEIHLGGGSRTEKHKTLTMGRVRKVVAGASVKTLADLQLDRVDAFLHSLHEAGWGARTLNHHVQATGGWCRWLAKNNRLAANPLHGLTTYNAEADVRHKRRALTIDEVSMLIESARTSGKKIQSYSPEMRARLYEIAFLTGLRRKELASLTPSSFDLKSTQPTLTVAAACSKHRRTDVLPLHPQLVRTIPEWVRGLKPTDRLFPGLEGKKTWLMVKKDLERVDIPYETPEGIADFHASGRHTYITELFRNGASLTEARKLARHTDVKMTMRYTHVGLADQAKALASLPEPTKATSAGQHIGRTARRQASDDRSRRDTARHKTGKEIVSESLGQKESSGTAWRKKTGDGDRSHTSPVSGGNRTPVELFLAGLRGWDSEIRRKVMS